MDTKEVIDALKKVPLFQNLDKKNLELVSKLVTPRHFNAGDVILQQGEDGIGFYLISAGKVEVSRGSGDDKISLAQLGQSDFFGEMALFEEAPRTATVTALEPTDCYVIVRWHFMGTLDTSPTIAVQMLPVIIKRLRKTQELL